VTCSDRSRIDAAKPGGVFVGVPGPPAWLHDVFRFSKETIDIWSPRHSFVGPSDIRGKYLLAMQEHVTTDKCTSCLTVHAMKGDKYIVELEREVTQARDKVGVPSYVTSLF
jgi:hypothetical protein